MAVEHTKTGCQKVWTACYCLTWLLLIIGCALWHFALVTIIPELQDLPDNLVEGFNVVLGFNYLEQDAGEVRNQAAMALAKCGVVTPPVSCNLLPAANLVGAATSNTEQEKAAIIAAFDRSLGQIRKVTNDKYFGTDELQATAQSLDDILRDVQSINATDAPCVGTNELYCEIHDKASIVVNEAANVQAEIDKFTDSDIVDNYKEGADYLVILHAVPYVLVLSALFFLCLWYKDGTCCCCSRSCCGCILIFFHVLLWILFFVVATALVVVSLAIMFGKDQIELEDLEGKPNVEEFLDHVEATYPEFWNVVFEDMIPGLLLLWRAAAVFWVFCVFIAFYGCCMCICRPYTEKDQSQD